MGLPAADEPLEPGDVGSLLAMFAEAIQEVQDERITIPRRGRPSKKHKTLAEAEELVRVAEGFETDEE